jgi:hypothetical protein
MEKSPSSWLGQLYWRTAPLRFDQNQISRAGKRVINVTASFASAHARTLTPVALCAILSISVGRGRCDLDRTPLTPVQPLIGKSAMWMLAACDQRRTLALSGAGMPMKANSLFGTRHQLFWRVRTATLRPESGSFGFVSVAFERLIKSLG